MWFAVKLHKIFSIKKIIFPTDRPKKFSKSHWKRQYFFVRPKSVHLLLHSLFFKLLTSLIFVFSFSAHTTQFTEREKWSYLKHGSGVGHLKNGGSYVTLVSNDGHDITIIVETIVSSFLLYASEPERPFSIFYSTWYCGCLVGQHFP